MSMQDTLAAMSAVAGWLEAEGVEVIAAGVDKVSGPRLHLWGPSLPDDVREFGDFLEPYNHRGSTKVGFIEDGVTVFWYEAP